MVIWKSAVNKVGVTRGSGVSIKVGVFSTRLPPMAENWVIIPTGLARSLIKFFLLWSIHHKREFSPALFVENYSLVDS